MSKLLREEFTIHCDWYHVARPVFPLEAKPGFVHPVRDLGKVFLIFSKTRAKFMLINFRYHSKEFISFQEPGHVHMGCGSCEEADMCGARQLKHHLTGEKGALRIR